MHFIVESLSCLWSSPARAGFVRSVGDGHGATLQWSEVPVSQTFDQDEITKRILVAITKRAGEVDPAQPVLQTHAPVILDGLVGATVGGDRWRGATGELASGSG